LLRSALNIMVRERCPRCAHPTIPFFASVVVLSLCLAVAGQEPCTTTNEFQITSSIINGYQVFLDGNLVGTEGKNGDKPDGIFTIYNIPCWSNHSIFVDDGMVTYTLEWPFGGGIPYAIILEDPLFTRGISEKADISQLVEKQSGSGEYINFVKEAEFEYMPQQREKISNNDSYNDQGLASNQPPSIVSLTPDLQSPQEVGSVITWAATATDTENDPLYYKFWLNGPRTGGNWQVVKDWSKSGRWSWNTQDSDIGSSSIRVWARDGKHAGTEDTDSFKEYNGYQAKSKQLAQLNVQITNDVYSENDRHLYYCQDGQYLSFKNRIYLIGPDLDKVKSVKYVLHESFQENTAPDSVDRANNFEIWIMTWGRFPIKALITTANGQVFEKDYEFSFKSKVEGAKRIGIPMVRSCE